MSAPSAITLRERFTSLLPQREDWEAAKRNPRADLIAGLTVAIVALPLALAFGESSGMGARAGIVTAVVAGVIAAIFGGSNLQVSGPTGAMTVVLVPVFHTYGRDAVLAVGLLAGVILIAMALLRLGQYVRFLPVPVVEGFTAGIAVTIALQQFPGAFGLPAGSQGHTWSVAADVVRRWLDHPHPAPVLMSIAVAALMLLGQRWRRGWPWSLIAVAVATLLAKAVDLPVQGIGHLPPGLPAPSLGFLHGGQLVHLIPSAFAVAALAALESLLCATVADSMTVNETHDPDRELFGQGVANLVVPLFGGVPATAAIARTAVNVRAGGRSKTSPIVHAIVLLAIVSALAPLVSSIPMAALAGVLFATTIRMVDASSLLALLRSTRADGIVLVLTFVITVALDLVDAVGVGLAVAIVLALRAVARSATIENVPLERGDHTLEEHELLAQHIVAYRIDGPLFFAAAHRFLLELADVTDVRAVILRMSRVSMIDATGAHVLDEAISRLEQRGIAVLVSGVDPEHAQVLRRMGVAPHLREQGRVLADTPEAIVKARELVGV